MKLRWNLISQFLATAVQFANAHDALKGVLPEEYRPLAAALIGAIQAAVALAAHYSNPDGTPLPKVEAGN